MLSRLGGASSRGRNGGLMSARFRVLIFVAVLALVGAAGSPARADAESRRWFAAYMTVFLANAPVDQKEKACLAFALSPQVTIQNYTRLFMNDYNLNYGPNLRPTRKVSYADANFVVKRAIPSTCSVEGRRSWNLRLNP
jgi:hypothetical protein